jgi:uncharacterized DUF497 family protein
MDVRFELSSESIIWDADKASRNFRKHGIRFEEAAEVFFDPLFVLLDASRVTESRDAAVGFDLAGRLLFVVHIEFEGESIRIISARRATPGEESNYAQ